MPDFEINPSENLAYWVGVAQTDGFLRKQIDNRYTKPRTRYMVKVNVVTSLPMLEKFKLISKLELNRSNSIWFDKKTGQKQFWISVNKLMPRFEKLDIDFSDPPRPPNWCLTNSEFFGAYMAGVIDGDGDVRVKRPRYPQCAIRIASSKPQLDLQKAINKMFNCSSNIIKVEKWKTFPGGRSYYLKTYVLEFNVSKKNYDVVMENIVPHLAMQHKKSKLIEFIKSKKEGLVSGFELSHCCPQAAMSRPKGSTVLYATTIAICLYGR